MREVALKEIRGAIYGGKLLVAFLLLTIAFLISLGMMSQEYRKRQDNYVSSISLPARDLFWNITFYWLRDDGRVIFQNEATMPIAKIKPPDPLLFFARGFDTEMRRGVDFFSNWPILDVNKQPEQEKNLLYLLFTGPDLLFMIKLLASLLAMLLAYDIFCGEREGGTLKLMLVCGASRSSIFAGKYLGRLFSIAVAFSAAFILYLLAQSFAAPAGMSGDEPARVSLMYVASLLHIATFFGLGAVISAFTRESVSSLVLTLFLWIVFVLVMPGMASLVAQQFAPADSEEHLSQSKFKKARDMETAYTAAHPELEQYRSGAYGVEHYEIRDKIVAELQKLEDEHQRRKDRQVALTASLARLSPVGSLSHLFTSLSRAGINDVELYRRDMLAIRSQIESLYQGLIEDPKFLELLGQTRWEVQQVIRETFEPVFDMNRSSVFSKATLAETTDRLWIDWLLMGFFALAPAALAYFRFIHYDPR